VNRTTIAAVATAPGQGGIGIVRVSGPEALAVAQRIFRPVGRRAVRDMKGYTAALGRLFDAVGDVDDAILTVYRAPKSYTGEDVAELSCHGGPVAVRALLRLCLENGAAPAEPGEFTKRAFLAGKMDLSQAEAVMDLIGASGEGALRAALSGRDGAISRRIAHIVDALTGLAAHMAAWADYPDEDVEDLDINVLTGKLTAILSDISQLLSTYDQGRILREGVLTAIVGKPNVGKSTLMNLLSGAQRSIVTDIPGTTRDVVEQPVQLGSCLLRLADTAGIRESEDPVEQMGIQLARRQIQQADLVLAVFDNADKLDKLDEELLASVGDKPCVAIVNKVDLPRQLDDTRIRSYANAVVYLSAKSGEGGDTLSREIQRVLGLSVGDPNAPMVANERQRYCLLEAEDNLRQALAAAQEGVTLDAVDVLLETALDKLLRLTGQRASTRVVEEVFERFCVGK